MDAASPVRFDIPDGCRMFAPFPRLPPELRQQIWRATVSTPGMHFVKLEDRGRTWRWISLDRQSDHSSSQPASENGEDFDEIAHQVKHEVTPKQTWETRLVPLATTKESDISCYRHINKQLHTLSRTCREAYYTAKSLKSQKDILRLGNGTPITLANSADVVFLEYLPHELFESGRSFGINPNCSGLDLIRRVAVRFCHQWQEKAVPSACTVCGQVHESANRVVYPVHLYQFLARHLPNLEEFYFVDYFLLRKAKGKVNDDGLQERQLSIDNLPPTGLKCGNRTFYEANEEDWNMKPQVLNVKSWLEDRFVRYAKASRLSKHNSPEKVRFGVLACEWNITPPVSLKSQPAAPVQKGRNKRVLYEDHAMRQSRRQVLRQKSHEAVTETEQPDADSGVKLLFGNGAKNSFQFTFSVKKHEML